MPSIHCRAKQVVSGGSSGLSAFPRLYPKRLMNLGDNMDFDLLKFHFLFPTIEIFQHYCCVSFGFVYLL